MKKTTEKKAFTEFAKQQISPNQTIAIKGGIIEIEDITVT